MCAPLKRKADPPLWRGSHTGHVRGMQDTRTDRVAREKPSSTINRHPHTRLCPRPKKSFRIFSQQQLLALALYIGVPGTSTSMGITHRLLLIQTNSSASKVGVCRWRRAGEGEQSRARATAAELPPNLPPTYADDDPIRRTPKNPSTTNTTSSYPRLY